jgi:hypothetical protein
LVPEGLRLMDALILVASNLPSDNRISFALGHILIQKMSQYSDMCCQVNMWVKLPTTFDGEERHGLKLATALTQGFGLLNAPTGFSHSHRFSKQDSRTLYLTDGTGILN